MLLLYFSIAGHRVVNFSNLHVYAATKFALTAISQGTRFELLAENTAGMNCRISVSLFCGLTLLFILSLDWVLFFYARGSIAPISDQGMSRLEILPMT